uniref:Active helicase ring shaped helicase n=1 Tax=Caudovirales sp. ctaix4 TaxID=2827635 RepID=A0A8S5S680_9CAUD|nr:MAG TPA: active helicase ring shaped helicase [Caudovirales sp. ctaix4]
MNTAEVDIDRVVDYKSEYQGYIKKAKITGDQLIGLCPFHDDRNNSFSVNLKTGQWHCFSEDIGGNFTQFYADINGIDTKEAYKQILEKYGISQEEKKEEADLKKNYTLTQYAFEKKLPEDWLKENCMLSTIKGRDGVTYMKIPYFDPDGKEATFRKRFANKDFRWKYGSSGKIGLYGEWKLPAIRQVGYAAMVEGESDSQSMWYMGVSTLGVPGASMFKPHQAALLQDLKLYIHQEPDKGGETFLRKIIEGLREGGFIGKVYRWSCNQIGCKDPSAVYIKYGKEEAREKIMRLIEAAEEIDLDAPEEIPEAIQGAPVNLRQPEGWLYSEKGISHIDEKKYTPTLVCRTPIILTQRLKSLETGEEKMEIAFKRDGVWHKAIFPRSTIFTARGITVLADLGCTVTSENAKMVVRFLSALEAENIDIINKSDATSTFGWQPGKRFIPGREQGIVLDIDPSQKGMATAYCQVGEEKKWIETMAPHRCRDKFRFILAASFAAPLLRILHQRIFFVYNWGGSKGGKTAALKAALSAWGDPERLMVNFNATQVGLERTASFYCDLPLGIDERQLAGRNQEGLEKTVYMIASGTGKIRGSKGGGLQATHQWRTVALATGEEPMSTETTQTGVSTRVLEIYGGPFENEKDAGRMHQESCMNYGWHGPAFVNRLIGLDERQITDKYEEMLKYVSQIADGKSGSHVSGISAVALADAMIDSWFFQQPVDSNVDNDSKEQRDVDNVLDILPESWERAKQMAATILKEQVNSDVGDVNENALQFVVDWVLQNRLYFGEKAIGTCLGTFSESGNTVYIFPSALNQALTKAGYSPRKTLKYMADRDLIASQERKDHKGKSYQVTKRFDNRLCKFVQFSIGKLSEKEDVIDIDDEEDAANTPPKDNDGFIPVQESFDLPFK